MLFQSHGNPHTHLWSFVAGHPEQFNPKVYCCPCTKSNPNDRSGVPSFVGEHFSTVKVAFLVAILNIE